MICPPCAQAADLVTSDNRRGNSWPQLHFPHICRDHAIQPHGCACQHGQARTPAQNHHRTREAQPA